MASRSKQKTGLIVTTIALLVTVGIVAAIVWWVQPNQDTIPADNENNTSETENNPVPEPEPTPDPNQFIDTTNAETLVIESLKIAMMYDKNLPGFEYHILRTAQGTQYIEFSTERLIGNKCTNDKGVFASFIKNPVTEEDKSTVSQQTQVNGDTYGLSLSGESCASNLELLSTYQKGLADYFGLLKPWEEN